MNAFFFLSHKNTSWYSIPRWWLTLKMFHELSLVLACLENAGSGSISKLPSQVTHSVLGPLPAFSHHGFQCLLHPASYLPPRCLEFQQCFCFCFTFYVGWVFLNFSSYSTLKNLINSMDFLFIIHSHSEMWHTTSGFTSPLDGPHNLPWMNPCEKRQMQPLTPNNLPGRACSRSQLLRYSPGEHLTVSPPHQRQTRPLWDHDKVRQNPGHYVTDKLLHFFLLANRSGCANYCFIGYSFIL